MVFAVAERVPADWSAGTFPASTSGRLILDGNGGPWYGQGDSAWSIFGQLSLAEAQTYIDSIAGYGYNAMLTMLVVKAALQDGSDGTDYLGRSAWTGTAFQSTLNAAYWDHVDDIIEYAASKNVTVIACPAYIGFGRGSQGWTTETTAASDAQMETFGGYIGDRLKGHQNLMWLIGHDATPNATDLSRQGAIVDGIKGAGDTHLMMCDGARSSVGTTVWAGWSNLSDMDVETAYTDYDDVKTITTAAWNAGTRPVLVPEGQYQDHPTGYPDDVVGRNQFWASFLAGAKAGYVAGHYYVHTFQATSPDWDTYLDDEIYDDTSRAGTLLRTLAWDGLTPDTADDFLTSGEGSGSTVAAAAFTSGLGVVYMPTSRAVTLDLSQIGPLSHTITRVDPTSGAEVVLDEAAVGGYTVASQGTNAGADSDWLLIVTENAPAGTTYGGWPDDTFGATDTVKAKTIDESSGTVTLTSADADYTVGVTGFGTTSMEIVPTGTAGSTTFNVVANKRYDGVFKVETSTDNMMLVNCYINSQVNSDPPPDRLVDPNAPNTIMLDCTMVGGPNGNIMGSGTWHMERCNLSDGVDIARMNSGTTAVACYFHHMRRVVGGHNDAIQSTTGGPQTIHRCHIVGHNYEDEGPARNNAILSAAIRFGDDPGPQSGTKIITDNLINGGATAVALGGSSATWTITGNRWLADPELGEGPFDFDGTDPETDGAIYRGDVYDPPTVGTITQSDNRWIGVMNVDAYYMGEPDGVDGSAVT